MTRLPEVISTVRRRRAWSTEEKIAILDAAFRPGGSVAAAADRFDVSRALIYLWRKQVRSGLMCGVTISAAAAAAFAPVAVVPDVPAQVTPISEQSAPAPRSDRGAAHQRPHAQGRRERRPRHPCPHCCRARRDRRMIAIPPGVRIYLAMGRPT
jgi:transposase